MQKDEDVVAPALNFLFLAGVLWWLVQPAAWRTGRAGVALLLAGLPAFALAFGLVPPAVIVKIPFVGNIVHVGNTFSCVLLGLGAGLAGLGFGDAWRKLGEPAARGVLFRYWLAAAGLLGLFFLATRGHARSSFFTGYAAALIAGLAVLPLGLHWGAGPTASRGSLWVALLLGLPLLGWRHGSTCTRSSTITFSRRVRESTCTPPRPPPRSSPRRKRTPAESWAGTRSSTPPTTPCFAGRRVWRGCRAQPPLPRARRRPRAGAGLELGLAESRGPVARTRAQI
ncbi:MAG: hypothetical protein WDM96_02770 [Lacunisphaera sp.]